ncbi:MAG: glucose-6-phosphate isomerase [Clostridiales bacterium GWE2_32_10]|nr:MAG: glucose-6-phosphate isomerase [Clostridiales bacterium GWE2_32_10]HBY21690.1 glucose-6-phosphate isomerase [Clostridiales bacterium]
MRNNDLRLKLDFNYMMEDFLEEHGIKHQQVNEILHKIEHAQKNMELKRNEGSMDFRDLPYNQDEVVAEIISFAEAAKDRIENFVVLGIGGSALGPIAVQQAINHLYYNELSKEQRKGYPKLYVLDNIDPEKIASLLDIIDIEKTMFNVISKSGSTAETMSQLMILETMLIEKVGQDVAKDLIVFTTDKEKGNLIKISKEKGYKKFIIPASVGGRFSQLTPVGLLPAAMCGIDIKQMLAGAALMDEMCKEQDVYINPGYMYAILQYIAMKKGANMCVMMPYADSLKYMADWYAQIWAESISKKYNNQGEIVNAGQTPIKALGVTDQHSQVQLYTEGPFDKVIVLMQVEEFKHTLEIPKIYEKIDSIAFMGGHTQNELIRVEQIATEYALMKAGRMNMTITLPKVNEYTIGQLIYLFEVATAFMGELMEVNAFDQPGVEEGKNATYAMFNEPGYEDKREEIMGRAAKKEDYVI